MCTKFMGSCNVVIIIFYTLIYYNSIFLVFAIKIYEDYT